MIFESFVSREFYKVKLAFFFLNTSSVIAAFLSTIPFEQYPCFVVTYHHEESVLFFSMSH